MKKYLKILSNTTFKIKLIIANCYYWIFNLYDGYFYNF